ncbi:hypothetical protein ABC977_07580 [Thioalkalicoccus limnaeus]|uniref:GTPase n=1 Tax=Thioalkalicoccus limnaeus TaxID=120681 RepID=A0ABV4BDK6_9GAMM
MTTDPIKGLLFVYNADSGLFNTLADIGHKMFSPQTYSCQLCAITHGLLTEKAAWREFIGSLEVPCEFLHRDELRRREPDLEIDLPAVLRITDDGLRVCIDASTLRGCRDLDALKGKIQRLCLGRR